MRARVIFSVENIGSAIPFHHQFIISRLVKEMTVLEPDFSGNKNFSFSGVKGQTKVGKEGLHVLSSKITIVFASLKNEFLEFLIQKIFTYKRIEIGSLRVRPESVELEEIPSFADNSSKYLCISPIVITNPKEPNYDPKKYVMPGSDDFSDLIYEATMINMDKTGLYSPEQMANFFRFQIVPDPEYLSKIKEEEKKIARVYNTYINDAKYEVRGYTLPFTLFAEPEVHHFIFNSGIGAINNEGFGMLDIPNTDQKRKTTPYDVKKGNNLEKE